MRPNRYPGQWWRLLGLISLMGCAPGSPGVYGAPATAPSSGALWTPPSRARIDSTALGGREVPSEVVAKLGSLTLADLIDLGLRSNPTTRFTWSNARAAAAELGAAKGEWWPSVTADVDATKLRTAGTQGRAAVRQTLYGVTAGFTWLLFDIGGRSGSIGAARAALIEANWTHNAAVQDVVLEIAGSYYRFAANQALLAARRLSLADADSNLAAAEERRRVGVATIADVLQARTAVEQARLAVQEIEGDVAATRGALAVSAGFPATLVFEVDTASSEEIGTVVDSLDTLLEMAKRERPDLAAGYAAVVQARERARVVASLRLPALVGSGSLGRTYLSPSYGGRDTYTLQLGLAIPIFNGFAWELDARAARARAEGEHARFERLGQEAILQVFIAYEAVKTAAERVKTAAALLESAQQSYEAAEGRYRAGVGTFLELLTAENTLATARAQNIEARFNWRISLLQLAHDVGVLDTKGTSPIETRPNATR